MATSDIISNLITLVIIIMGGALIQIFIKRAFKAIDSKLLGLEKWLDTTSINLSETITEVAVLQENVKEINTIRESLSDINEFRLELSEKYQLKQDASDKLQEINQNLEKLLEKVNGLNGKKKE